MSPTQAEIKLVQLKSCFVNIPQSVVTVLDNAKAVVQNVIVELHYRDVSPNGSVSKRPGGLSQRSVYAGWTGMASAAKPISVPERSGRRMKEDFGVVEIDATFGRMLGLADGMKVSVLLHLDPPLAHTVHIEPLTPADWEIIELHASFLESNLLFQVRALPNPSFSASASAQAQQAHPLTIHLSPTSTANIIISSLVPPQSSSKPFAKIAPDGEVIVAPKTRPRAPLNARTASSRSATSISRRSAGAGSGTTRQRSYREVSAPSAVFLRGLDQSICGEFFEEDNQPSNQGASLSIWLDPDIASSRPLRNCDYVSVSVIKPAGIEPPVDPQEQQRLKDIDASDAGRPAMKVVAKLLKWEDAPDSHHAALSPALSAALNAASMVGGLVRVEVAPQPVASNDIGNVALFPFTATKETNEGLRFGSQTKVAQEAVADKLSELYGSQDPKHIGLLNGPLTDGLVLARSEEGSKSGSFEGVLVRFGPRATETKDTPKAFIRWCIGSNSKDPVQVRQEISKPFASLYASAVGADPLPLEPPSMIGIDSIIAQLTSHLSHCSSVLLTGGLGAGKSTLVKLLGHRLRARRLYHTSYFSCRKLMTDETRTSTVKETLTRLFMTASWGTKLGGRALIILDDLDRLCPAETELQTSDNGRSRQNSELICSLVRQYCGANSSVAILASAQGREALNNVIVGGHVVREIVPLKVPNKDGRKRLLQALTSGYLAELKRTNGINGHSRSISEDNYGDKAAWMADSPRAEAADSVESFDVDRDLDFLDIAGQTHGYMPGDLVLLVARAKSEALIRSVEQTPNQAQEPSMRLTRQDFQNALRNFTPASLRNVTLQSSKTTFNSIGGLYETRKVLLETLQYPTTYAPIFAQCPLRLRSGLLLYGFPGCGKTLLASAVAGECGLNFISVKGPEILNKYIGASEKSVRDLFERAEAAKPCVLFFDEFDSIAPKRGHDSTGVTDRVVNQLLTQMDGAEGLSGVYVLAATSRPDLIDPALLRPGRLDKSLLCDMPDLNDRRDILQALAKKLSIAPAITKGVDHRKSFSEVAARTAGYSGADLQAVIYNAHLEAIHDVLGDQGTNGESSRQHGQTTSKPDRTSNYDILQFRFGTEEASDGMNTSTSRAKQASEYAAIVAKLDAIKLAQRKERRARRGAVAPSTNGIANDDPGEAGSKQEVTIEWKHIEASLATTRSSVGADERRRLDRIYREFVVGRNGEMPDGQGPTEVGGRSSLM